MTATFPISSIPEFSKSDKIIVVGIIGKSAYNRRSMGGACWLECPFSSEIECSWDEEESVLYLHMYLHTEGNATSRGAEEMAGVTAARLAGDFLVAAGDMSADAADKLLLLFHLCHLLVLCSPTPVFDLSHVQLFKAIDAVRTDAKAKVCELLQSTVGPDWLAQGRPCCPRVLFYFDTCPRQLKSADISRIKTFEHNLEDQIYNILRKTRIITNMSSKSLMAVPKNEEFVYVNDVDTPPGSEINRMVRSLISACESPSEAPEWNKDESKRGTFKQFVQTHLDLAFTSGFDDNVGKFATFSPFEAPSAATWRKAAKILTDFFRSPDSRELLSPLWETLSIDTKFSQGRCAKVLPLAQAGYMENLPSHYSMQHHRQKVAMALSLFSSVARGPLADWYRKLLEDNCNQIWETRRLCEKLSLTGNPCIKPKHGSEADDSHSSGVKYIAACNCGRTKGSRDDPYTVKLANFEFYSNLGKDCQCGTSSEKITFPVFQPSTDDFRAASVKSGASVPLATVNSGVDSPVELSQTSLEEPLSNIALSDTNIGPSAIDLSSADHLTILDINEAQFKDKGLVRQPSTTEYLPGMLHTESPPGLLPTFSSWALTCLGFSSLYSHNIGLPEHLHPGFLPHLNFLVPWDCSVRQDHSSWRSNTQQKGGGRGKSFSSMINVKIFLGMEYECPRGHRFMMSYCNEIITGNTFQKDAGAKLANSDMPIYHHCPCRGSKQMIGQLMRVHVVSPKAPVHIILKPKVQPVQGGPVFVPGGDQPLQLTGAAYWVLRLPYVYSTERGPLPRPVPPLTPATRGRLLQGMIGVTE